MSSLSNDTVTLARQEAFKDFSYFDEETVPANIDHMKGHNLESPISYARSTMLAGVME